MKNRLFGKIIYLLVITVIAGACSDFQDKTDYSEIEEPIKDLSGTWKILLATRNSQDITSMMDFTKFRLRLNSDGSYALENPLPFLVRSNGQWKTDDPQYPFVLTFAEDGASANVDTELYFPVVDGKRRISLTFSPGCHSNTYTYVFVSETF